MRKLTLVLLFALSSISYASCMGPYCWDDTGASISGVRFTGTMTVTGQEILSYTNTSNPALVNNGTLVLRSAADANAQLNLGYSSLYNVGYLQSAIYGYSYVPLVLQPVAGKVTIGTTSPSDSAILQIDSTSLGFLMPRMTTTERDAISSVAEGLQIYNLTTHTVQVSTAANSTSWVSLN